MAKKSASILVKLVSSAGTGFYYVARKNAKKEKMEVRKYDPVKREHVTFKEAKLK